MAQVSALLANVGAWASAHPLPLLGACTALGLALMLTSARKG
jgi:hypothetical protein